MKIISPPFQKTKKQFVSSVILFVHVHIFCGHGPSVLTHFVFFFKMEKTGSPISTYPTPLTRGSLRPELSGFGPPGNFPRLMALAHVARPSSTSRLPRSPRLHASASPAVRSPPLRPSPGCPISSVPARGRRSTSPGCHIMAPVKETSPRQSSLHSFHTNELAEKF